MNMLVEKQHKYTPIHQMRLRLNQMRRLLIFPLFFLFLPPVPDICVKSSRLDKLHSGKETLTAEAPEF